MALQSIFDSTFLETALFPASAVYKSWPPAIDQSYLLLAMQTQRVLETLSMYKLFVW